MDRAFRQIIIHMIHLPNYAAIILILPIILSCASAHLPDDLGEKVRSVFQQEMQRQIVVKDNVVVSTAIFNPEAIAKRLGMRQELIRTDKGTSFLLFRGNKLFVEWSTKMTLEKEQADRVFLKAERSIEADNLDLPRDDPEYISIYENGKVAGMYQF